MIEELRKEVRVVLAKDTNVGRPSRFLWTPSGLVDLAEPLDLCHYKPLLLGTFEFPRDESAPLDMIPYRPSRAFQDRRRFVDVDQRLSITGDSSHDSGPVLG